MKVNYEKLSSGSKSEKSKVGYFNLKDDGDEAIVRFAYDNPANFDVVTVHRVKVGDYYRNISCLRDGPKDDESKCPLCSSTDKEVSKVSYKFFVKLVEYVKDENGIVKPIAKVWSRPVGFAKELKAYFDDYGPLTDVVFKIKRDGAKGSRDTKYTLVYANPAVYKPDIYKKDFSGFSEDFDLAHHSYMVKKKEDLQYFLEHGDFPGYEKKENTKDSSDKKDDVKSAVPFEPTPFDNQTPDSTPAELPAENPSKPVRNYPHY